MKNSLKKYLGVAGIVALTTVPLLGLTIMPASAIGVGVNLNVGSPTPLYHDDSYYTCYHDNYTPYYCNRDDYNVWFREHPSWNHYGHFQHSRHENIERHDGIFRR